MNDSTQIQLTIKASQHKIKLSDALDRLMKNGDFQFLFEKTYLNEYAIRLVELKVTHSQLGEANQAYIDGQLTAIGHLRQYMNFVLQEGRLAAEAIKVDREELNRIDSEGRSN